MTDHGSPHISTPDPVAVIRHEEQLLVDTETVPVERVRVQKIIVSEEKTFTVTVRREEVRLIREPYTGETPDTGMADSSGTPHIMILHEERVIMTTEVVPVERVWLHVHQIADTETVTETLAHEQITLTCPDNTHRHTQ